jgi:hypothetical protein
MFNWNAAFWAFRLVLVAVVAVFAAAAWDEFLTPWQMQYRKHIDRGISLLWHGGFQASLVILPFIMAYVVGHYAREWSVRDMVYAYGTGLVITIAMGVFYWWNRYTDALFYDGLPSLAGWVFSLTLMSGGFGVILLFFRRSTGHTTLEMYVMFFVLMFYVFVATHGILKLEVRSERRENLTAMKWAPPDCDQFSDWPTVGTYAAAAFTIIYLSRNTL